MEEPGFWDDPERSTKTVREAKNLKDTVETYRHLEQQYEDIQIMIEMGYEENDPSMIPEIQEMLDEFINSLEDIYRQCARQDVTRDIMRTLSISETAAKRLYLHMMLYTHGIASMIATKAAHIPNEEIRVLTDSAFHAFLNQIRTEEQSK